MENDQTIHRIRIQKVEVAFEDPGNTFKMKDELSEVCRRRLLPAIQQLFEKKYANGPLLSIPSLVIDAGLLPAENWGNSFVSTVIRRLERYLDAEEAARYLREDLSGKCDFVAGEHKRRASFILSYLENGLLPWNAPFEGKSELRNELMQLLNVPGRQAFLNKQAVRRWPVKGARNLRAGFKGDLLRLLAENFNAMKRFLYLVPEKKILPVMIKRKWDRGDLRMMQKNWNAIFGLAGLPEEDRDAVFLHALLMLHDKKAGQAQPFADALSQEIVRVLEQWYKPVFQKLPEVLEKYLILLPVRPVPAASQVLPVFPAPETTPVRFTEEPVYIRNAGLVLLHPFLHHLFENTGHTVKHKWDSAELKRRSLILTQYLVREQCDYTEHDLLLNKIMVGFPVETPLPLDITLSDFEKNEVRELLGSVIKHWKALRHTSITTLRQTLLLQPGKITHRQDGWLLEIGQRIPGALSGKIPWDVTTIQTPWMKKVLHVEWAGN